MEDKIEVDKLKHLEVIRNLAVLEKENMILRRQLKDYDRIINSQNDRIKFLYKEQYFWFTKASEYWEKLNKINN